MGRVVGKRERERSRIDADSAAKRDESGERRKDEGRRGERALL